MLVVLLLLSERRLPLDGHHQSLLFVDMCADVLMCLVCLFVYVAVFDVLLFCFMCVCCAVAVFLYT